MCQGGMVRRLAVIVVCVVGDAVQAGGPFGDGDVEITFMGPGDGGQLGQMQQIPMNDFGNSFPLLDLMNSPMKRVQPRDQGPLLLMGGAGGPFGGLGGAGGVFGGGGGPMIQMGGGGGGDQMIDPFLVEMMQRMGLQVDGAPKVHDACAPDVKKWCVGENAIKEPSVLHCLSTHSSEISTGCFQKIKSTLPHVCHNEIQDLCGELLDEGVLACLERQLPKVKGRCLDAYVTARHHIEAVASSTSINFMHTPSGKIWPMATQEVEKAWHSAVASAQAASSSTVVPVGCVLGVFFMLYWMSQDGNRQLVLSGAHAMTQYKFEGSIQQKSRTVDAAYGSTLTI